ncbi:hypothetical protein TCAL_16040 [Tigriopus californicus]|uniref:Uncharacterized protein n=1 Tax=Tigriopus californicus TaxID=6832 RepID=A0A553PNS3_TIGCA|nr:uncharacterized protein LOC131882827 [Tigriopus californicus]TRY79332.1 hypothetical protein TCAL_16040 [Tigriopus californicus]
MMMRQIIPLSVILLAFVPAQVRFVKAMADTPEGCPVCECPEPTLQDSMPMGRSLEGEDNAPELWEEENTDYHILRVPKDMMFGWPYEGGNKRKRRSVGHGGPVGHGYGHGYPGHGYPSHGYPRHGYGHPYRHSPYGYNPYGYGYIHPYSKSGYKFFDNPYKSGELVTDKEYYQSQ